LGPLMAVASLGLSRAGAATVAELAAFGLPSVLVPYPHAAGGHQELNAEQLGEGAIVVAEAQLDVERARGIARLAGHEGADQRRRMGVELRRRMPSGGADAVASAVLDVLDRDPARGPARQPASSPHRMDPMRGAGELPRGLPGHVHVLGIGGAGASGLARLLVARGGQVTGHDREESPRLEALREQGIEVSTGASTVDALPDQMELLVRSAAVPADDPQVRGARERGVPVLKYAEALGRWAPAGRTLAVAGTHGKTSTCWLTLHALRGRWAEEDGRHRPGGLIGGECLELLTNAIAPGSEGAFVVEACEYDWSFLQLSPRTAVVTNVDADHLDCFGDFEGCVRAFADFVARVDPDGLVLLGPDVPEAVERAARAPVWRFGRELHVVVEGATRGRYRFTLKGPGFEVAGVELGVPGRVMVDNAALALAAALHTAGVEQAPALARSIGTYRGAGRRFEVWYEHESVALVHDYAHHPVELRATLRAATEVYPGRPLAVLFQPHQYERTARFLDDFAASFDDAQRVVVSAVYGARRAVGDAPAAEAEDLVERLRARGVQAVAGGTLDASVERLLESLERPATVMVVGAGDVETIRDDLVRRTALRCGQPG
ncbi:MAG: Mur ligase domain-containing protein, partial [Planctomycetota bacterium]